MCTALVVREDYWRQQRRVLAELSGVDYEYVERLNISLRKIAYETGKVVKQIFDSFTQAFKKVIIQLGDITKGLVEILKKVVKETEISKDDDYITVCNKFENRLFYLERKQSIQREQYYRNCFKIAKLNYVVRNHDRRC